MESTAEDSEGLTLIYWTEAIAIKQGNFFGERVDDFETKDGDRDAAE
ncbi:hypothetical protein [Oscillatoria acuminata]|nr:hypothetical protein [Oscillatoria acuminata]